jgi:GTP-binding protein HflX
LVFNKIDSAQDSLKASAVQRACADTPHMMISARSPESVARLKDALLETVRQRLQQVSLFVPYVATELTNRIYATSRVVDSRAEELGMHFVIEAEPHLVADLVWQSQALEPEQPHEGREGESA